MKYKIPAVPLKLYGNAIPLFRLQQALGTDAASSEIPTCKIALGHFSSEGMGCFGRCLPGFHRPRLSEKPVARSVFVIAFYRLLYESYHLLGEMSTGNTFTGAAVSYSASSDIRAFRTFCSPVCWMCHSSRPGKPMGTPSRRKTMPLSISVLPLIWKARALG